MNANSGSKRWQPGFLLTASAVLHLFAIPAVLILPNDALWIIAMIICDHLLIIAAGLLPRSKVLGSNWTQLPSASCGEIALTIDDGPDVEVTPQVLDILDHYQAKATFFCIGERAQAYPELCREIIKRGHAVENHSQHHWHYFSLLVSMKQIRSEIETAQQTLTAITGIAPLFFRPTAGLRNLLLDPVLCRMNLQLASWTRRGFDTYQTQPQRVLDKLLKNLKAGDILLLHDGNAARTAAGVPLILEVLPQLLAAIKAANLQPVTLKSSL
jgi:peptidoglycan/xylan/chitin deacetylase (PgdA/CDA1 family)